MGSYYRHLNDIQRQLMAFDVKNVGLVMALIENISDDDDVVKVVRCKDCVYANFDGTICRCGVRRYTTPNGYCEKGCVRNWL